jgi:hypothetical protein
VLLSSGDSFPHLIQKRRSQLGFVTYLLNCPRNSTEAGCLAPKKKRSVPSAGKVMESVFWDAEGILFIDYLEKGKTITGEYYSNLSTSLDENIREKRPGLQKKKIIFHQNNALAHKSVLAMGRIKGSAL